MKCPKCGSEKTPKQIREELRSWDKLVGKEEFHVLYDQGYVLGFRMALKWMLGLKIKDGEHR